MIRIRKVLNNVIFQLILFNTVVLSAYAMDETVINMNSTTMSSTAKIKPLATKKEAKALFNWAMVYLMENGRAIAYEEFNKRNGKFTERDLYVFCLDFDRTWTVMGANSSLIGNSAADRRDSNGKDYVEEFLTIAKSTGSGVASYVYNNPVTHEDRVKTSFIQKVSDNEFCGMGYYK